MLAVDFFGLGQDAPASVPASTRSITMPAIPDGAVVRCNFDQTINSYRCAPVSLFEPPTVFLLAAAGVAVLAIGYTLGRVQFLPRYARRVAEERLTGAA